MATSKDINIHSNNPFMFIVFHKHSTTYCTIGVIVTCWDTVREIKIENERINIVNIC